MAKLNLGKDLYVHGRIGWRGLSKEEYLKNGFYRIINATSLMDGYVDWNNCGYITKERYEESTEIMLQENDILISKDGTLGKIGYVKNMKYPCTVASGIFVVRNTKKDILNFDYLYHILKSSIFKDFIARNKAIGSTISHLYQRDLENFEIELPDIKVQEKIANVLNCLDEKIKINNMIVEKLQKILLTEFSHMFISIDDKDIIYLGQIADLYQPKTISGNQLIYDGKYYVYGANGIIGKYDQYNHSENQIAVACRGASCGSVTMTLPFSWITGNAMVVSPLKSFPYKEFIYYMLVIKSVSYLNTGSAQPQLTRENLQNYSFKIKNRDLINSFEGKAVIFRKKIISIEMENNKLLSIREWLLPILMNGQVLVD